MSPSYIPILDGESKMFNFTTDSQEDSEQVTQPWQLNGECPDGTIPIIRTKKQNFLRASSIKSIPHQFSAHTQITNGVNHEVSMHSYRILARPCIKCSKIPARMRKFCCTGPDHF